MKRGTFAPCKGVWCGRCYKDLKILKYPVRPFVDEDGEVVEVPGDELRFREARNGDQLLTSFQCETCHFRNIKRRDPQRGSGSDLELLAVMRQANLDAFWSREPTTVRANLRGAMRLWETEIKYDLPSTVGPIGPYPLGDELGMSVAIAVLDRSLDKGMYEDHVQWETFRKTMSAVTNMSQAGLKGLEESVGAYERNRMWISNSPSHKFWFSRFMTGIHKRVGELVKRDKPITIDVLKKVEEILEREFSKAKTLAARHRAAQMGVWFIVGFCTGLRGEEMQLIDLPGTRGNMKYLKSVDPHFRLKMIGRTKGNQLGGTKFEIPCVPTTSGSCLRPEKWLTRLLNTLKEKRVKTGRLLTRKLNPPRLGEFEDDFFRVLETVQATTNLIDKEIDVREEYGLKRSIRRGVSEHTTNMKVPEKVINAMNRWRSDLKAKGPANMLDLYTTLEGLVPTLLNYSRAL